MNQKETKGERLMKLCDVLERTKFSKTFLYSLIASGAFPKQIHIGRSVFWVEREVDNYINELIKGRNAT